MNTPMIYWFIPRGVFHFFDYLLIGLFILWLIWIAIGIYDPARGRRLRSSILGLITLALVAWWGYGNYQERQAWEVRQAYFKAAWDHFHKRCESAHVTYYKTVPPQDAVFIMKPAERATSAQLKDQFWMGDPYDLPDEPKSEVRGLLFRQKSLPKSGWDARHGQGGFDFVEVAHPKEPGKYQQFLLVPDGESDTDGNPTHKVGQRTTSTSLARYGYTWDDISTKEDRHFWVAGGRLRVVDLETGEVVAERVGFVIEPKFGATSSTFNQTPWSNAHSYPYMFADERRNQQTLCPKKEGRREFISTALGTWNELQPQGSNK